MSLNKCPKCKEEPEWYVSCPVPWETGNLLKYNLFLACKCRQQEKEVIPTGNIHENVYDALARCLTEAKQQMESEWNDYCKEERT